MRKAANKKVVTKGSVIPQKVSKTKPEDPNVKWANMKEALGLDDDEMPDFLRLEIENWNNAPATRRTGVTRGKPNKPLNHIMQAEMTIKSLQYPLTPQIVKKCKQDSCGELFRTAYEFVSYCSDFCRSKELSSKFGIEWVADQFSTKNEIELWMGSVPPGIVPQSALAVMKFLVADSEERTGETIEPWSPNRSKPEPDVQRYVPAIAESQPEPSPPIPSTLGVQSVRDRLADLRSRRERVTNQA